MRQLKHQASRDSRAWQKDYMRVPPLEWRLVRSNLGGSGNTNTIPVCVQNTTTAKAIFESITHHGRCLGGRHEHLIIGRIPPARVPNEKTLIDAERVHIVDHTMDPQSGASALLPQPPRHWGYGTTPSYKENCAIQDHDTTPYPHNTLKNHLPGLVRCKTHN